MFNYSDDRLHASLYVNKVSNLTVLKCGVVFKLLHAYLFVTKKYKTYSENRNHVNEKQLLLAFVQTYGRDTLAMKLISSDICSQLELKLIKHLQLEVIKSFMEHVLIYVYRWYRYMYVCGIPLLNYLQPFALLHDISLKVYWQSKQVCLLLTTFVQTNNHWDDFLHINKDHLQLMSGKNHPISNNFWGYIL